MYQQMLNEKRAAPPTFLRWRQLFAFLLLCACMKQIPYEGEHSIKHSIFKTCIQRRKDHFSLFLNTNTRSGRTKNAYQIDCSRLLSFCNMQV